MVSLSFVITSLLRMFNGRCLGTDATKRFSGLYLHGFLCVVLQEAVSTGDPEMVQLVLQRRDYLKASTALGGVPELLSKIREVSLCAFSHCLAIFYVCDNNN